MCNDACQARIFVRQKCGQTLLASSLCGAAQIRARGLLGFFLKARDGTLDGNPGKPYEWNGIRISRHFPKFDGCLHTALWKADACGLQFFIKEVSRKEAPDFIAPFEFMALSMLGFISAPGVHVAAPYLALDDGKTTFLVTEFIPLSGNIIPQIPDESWRAFSRAAAGYGIEVVSRYQSPAFPAQDIALDPHYLPPRSKMEGIIRSLGESGGVLREEICRA